NSNAAWRSRMLPMTTQNDEWLFRRDANFRCRRLDVRRDVLFEFGEVLLEHRDQVARGFVELSLVLPGLEGVQQMRFDTRDRRRHREPEIGIRTEIGIFERTVERGGYQRARRLDRHATADTVFTAGPAGIDQPDVD